MGALFASNSCTTACSPVDPPPVGPGGEIIKRMCEPRGTVVVAVGQEPFTLNGAETAEALPVLASSVYPSWPRAIERSGKTAWPARFVIPFNVPLSAALEHGGSPLKLITRDAPTIGALLASVRCTRIGLPVRICPPVEYCGWLRKVTVAGTAVVPAAAMSIT